MTNRGLTGVRADRPSSYRKLEAVAKSVRKCLRFPMERAIDPLFLFENVDEITIRRHNGATVPLRSGVTALEGSEGYTRYDDRRNFLEILASDRTYEWLETRHHRGVYFVAHELGHCILHADQLIRLARLPARQQAAFHRNRESHRPLEDTEWQANAFAAALLMPASGLAELERETGRLTPSLISRRFRTSSEAAGYRLTSYRKRKALLLRT